MHSEGNKGYRSGYASVNGLRMYYEIHGTGRPLVLLHGSLTTIDTSFGKFLPSLSDTGQVIAMNSRDTAIRRINSRAGNLMKFRQSNPPYLS